MTLNLNIADFSAAKPRKAITADYVRPLNEADFAMLDAKPTQPPAERPSLQRITDRHHALARLLAAGTPEGQAAATLNYSQSRVSVIKASPAFQELLALYRAEVDREFVGVLEHMGGLSRDAILELRERMEDKPEGFTNRELLSLVTEMVDRSVDDSGKAAAPVRIELVAPDEGEAE